MDFTPADTAIVITDPQNDVLKENGMVWGLVGPSIRTNNTVDNLERLMTSGKELGFGVFISPHYYYPTDQKWQFGGPIETMMHDSHMFSRAGALDLTGFAGSGADWLDKLAPVINDGETVVTSPHKAFGPSTNDLVLQLRKRGIQKVILGGMLANLCVESHLRDLIEAGFEVAVVPDATAAPNHPELGDGNAAAAINFNFVANQVLSTDQAIEAMKAATA
ncbi:cysteine hydrolase [Lacisediminihabitans changchengi]|uniref:Cysteine hydrolase n=1 Tax=Lacisediminihabitans changchengi TaxID=2787634 RepID=A0A934SN72_9MICO|nr:cysteine hydrolase [Lacisediminihabitans changchengi]MBK4348491.1 cysteine hydrolase [Lacisediminihabitans changchengi]